MTDYINTLPVPPSTDITKIELTGWDNFDNHAETTMVVTKGVAAATFLTIGKTGREALLGQLRILKGLGVTLDPTQKLAIMEPTDLWIDGNTAPVFHTVQEIMATVAEHR